VNKSQQFNLQDGFLNQARKEAIPVTIYLINGYQIKGQIKGFDNFTVVIDENGRQALIYKHAISTIMPSRPLSTSLATPPATEAQPAKSKPGDERVWLEDLQPGDE